MLPPNTWSSVGNTLRERRKVGVSTHAVIRVVLGLLLAPLPSVVSAQQVVPSGSFTPGHTFRVLNPQGTAVGDAGGSAGSNKNGSGYLSELGITNTGTPLCINDALTNAVGGYHQLCFGANVLGGGIISYEAHDGASPLPFIWDVNGTSVQFPFGAPFSVVVEATGSYTPPTLPSGGSVTVRNTATGAALGNFAVCSFSNSLAGIVLTGYVDSANSVTAVFNNITSLSISPAVGTLVCDVYKL